MNTDVEVILADVLQSPVLRRAEQVFQAVEQRFSRFLADSELTRLNASAGRATAVSPEMLQLLTRARELNRRSLGAFEPAILGQLEASGYDRSFELIGYGDPVAPGAAASGGSIARVTLDLEARTALLPAGTRLDFGGIGKGFAVDQTAELLAGCGGFIVNGGGDVYAAGLDPDGDAWRIGVMDPWEAAVEIEQVELKDAAIATSSTVSRRWRTAGGWSHHLIDPRTGRPVTNGLAAASVIAPTATEADVFAKSALILGLEAGSRLLDAEQFAGLFVGEDGRIVTTRRWPTRREQ
jgi:thiamine biosynthesis lipoprotein